MPKVIGWCEHCDKEHVFYKCSWHNIYYCYRTYKDCPLWHVAIKVENKKQKNESKDHEC